ncbi:DUF501 domain-containing protein [Candidatus Aquiluna sp. UB-MaderosW2red]|uniref:DUF501 domain-containing protein n=1 Tax=Candidatus Aquiluna sp. UB-MaderosW2red TaxID=1855377 RepID=UPI000875E456|nr:DUF501 domain-containing protein [Candidatus Aquiluna sp. UB-MaderosW2red]SCX08787.1 hypothetical protein SAMN05216534_0834 [Candidatus Aquiluna sp. UB-MaderosW2red]
MAEVSQADIAEVSRQLGRPARDILEIAARCVCGRPLVVKTKPRLENGTPFPTLYYLTQQAATAAASTLETSGFMVELQDLLLDQEIAAQYLLAHQEYLREREEIELVEEIVDFSAGGMPVRVKCLHALIGHSLAKGPGVNPMGDRALERLSWSPTVCSCV